MNRLQALKAKKKEAVARMEALLATADKEGRDLTNDEADDFSALEAEIKTIDARIEREETFLAANPGEVIQSVDTRPDASGGDRIGKVKEAWQDDPKCGYEQPRDFLKAVMEAGRTGRQTPQLKFLAAAGSDEHSTVSDSYGGYLLPKGFSPNMLSVGVEMDPTAGLVTPIPMTTQVLDIPARTDKNHTTSVSGGLTVSRRVETQEPTASRMAMEQVELKATGLFGLAYASEEILERSPISFAALLEAGFRDEFPAFMLNEKIHGAGVTTGVLNSPALVAVDRNTNSQILGVDIVAMRKRIYNYRRAIWIANHDTLTYLTATHVAFTNSDQPLFSFGNGTDRPDTLMGRPIYFSEFPSALGTKGDLLLCDWSQYLWGTLTGLRSADSVHVRFLNHERTFKFWMENCGQPWWRSALTPKKGANTLSPFVTLDT